MVNTYIVPQFTLNKGESVELHDTLDIAKVNFEEGYNPPEGIFLGKDNKLLPEIGTEVLYLEAFHYPYHKKGTDDPVEVQEVKLLNDPVVTLTKEEYEAEGFLYSDICRKWEVLLRFDGWYKFILHRVPITPLSSTDIYYNVGADKLFRGIGIDAVPVEVYELRVAENIKSYAIERFYVPYCQKAHDRTVFKKTQLLIDNANYTPAVRELKDNEDVINSFLAGACEIFDAGKKYEAQRIVELCIKYIEDERI